MQREGEEEVEGVEGVEGEGTDLGSGGALDNGCPYSMMI